MYKKIHTLIAFDKVYTHVSSNPVKIEKISITLENCAA